MYWYRGIKFFFFVVFLNFVSWFVDEFVVGEVENLMRIYLNGGGEF